MLIAAAAASLFSGGTSGSSYCLSFGCPRPLSRSRSRGWSRFPSRARGGSASGASLGVVGADSAGWPRVVSTGGTAASGSGANVLVSAATESRSGGRLDSRSGCLAEPSVAGISSGCWSSSWTGAAAGRRSLLEGRAAFGFAFDDARGLAGLFVTLAILDKFNRQRQGDSKFGRIESDRSTRRDNSVGSTSEPLKPGFSPKVSRQSIN